MAASLSANVRNRRRGPRQLHRSRTRAIHPTEPVRTGIANGRYGAITAASQRPEHWQLDAVYRSFAEGRHSADADPHGR